MAEQEGLVTSIIVGVGMVIVSVIILFLIISTLNDADLLRAGSSNSVVNESGGSLNGSNPYTLATFSKYNRDYFIIRIYNVTLGIGEIAPKNYSFNPVTGVIINGTGVNYESVNITYGYYPQTTYEQSFDNMSIGLTTGVGNVSTKLPTVLLIAAVVLLFGVLVILVAKAKVMSNEGFSGGSSKGVGTSVSGEGPSGTL